MEKIYFYYISHPQFKTVFTTNQEHSFKTFEDYKRKSEKDDAYKVSRGMISVSLIKFEQVYNQFTFSSDLLGNTQEYVTYKTMYYFYVLSKTFVKLDLNI